MPGPHPAVAATRVAVRAVLAARSTDDGPVLVACSGGADSLALAAATAFEAPRAGRPAGAVVVDHALQAGSDAVARQAAAACRALGLAPVLVVRVVVGSAGGPEAAARDARYAALARAADEQGAAAVLLGHTLDDQAEQVLLGLARGSGPRALAGMPAARGPFVRPFLQLRRADTAAACAALGLVPWQDPTNAGPGLRAAVRHRLLPALVAELGPGVPANLARTADQLREVADVVDEQADRLVARATGVDGGWDAAVLAAAPAGLRRAALRRLALAAGAPAGSLARTHVLALDDLVVGRPGRGPVALPGGRVVVRDCGRLAVQPARAPQPGGQ